MMPPITREQKVSEFNKAAGGRSSSQGGEVGPQIICFSEELEEFAEALAQYSDNPHNLEYRAHLIKEWADVQVTLSNLAWFFEFNGEEAFNRVHENNMTKISPSGVVIRRESDGKVLKPEGYQPPDMRGL